MLFEQVATTTEEGWCVEFVFERLLLTCGLTVPVRDFCFLCNCRGFRVFEGATQRVVGTVEIENFGPGARVGLAFGLNAAVEGRGGRGRVHRGGTGAALCRLRRGGTSRRRR